MNNLSEEDKKKQFEKLKNIMISKKVIKKAIVRNEKLQLPKITGMTEEEEKKLKEELEERRKIKEKQVDKAVNKVLFFLIIVIFIIAECCK